MCEQVMELVIEWFRSLPANKLGDDCKQLIKFPLEITNFLLFYCFNFFFHAGYKPLLSPSTSASGRDVGVAPPCLCGLASGEGVGAAAHLFSVRKVIKGKSVRRPVLFLNVKSYITM